jgi:hypothetical protein
VTRLPVLVVCDRLHARLSHEACVGRYTARVVSAGVGDRPATEGRHRHPECAGCPQGALRAGATALTLRRHTPTPPPALGRDADAVLPPRRWRDAT